MFIIKKDYNKFYDHQREQMLFLSIMFDYIDHNKVRKTVQ